MNIKDVLINSLKANGFNGLFCAGECLCTIDDLRPCGCPRENCEPGHLRPVIMVNTTSMCYPQKERTIIIPFRS